MAATVERYVGLGIEPTGVTENGPFVADPVVAGSLPASPSYALAAPSFIEVEVNGGTDNTGTVTVTGVVNGASTTEDFDFAGPGGTLDDPLRVKGSKLFTSITALSEVGLSGEATEATIGIRVSDRVYLDYMTESLNAKRNIIKADKNVRSRHSRKSQTGKFSVGGDFDFMAEPENGLGLLLKATFGDPTSTPKDGVQIETAAGTGSTAPAGGPTGTKRLIIVVNSITGSGTITVSGDVNGTPDTDVVSIPGTGTFYTLKAFDDSSLTDYTASGGITAIDYDVKQADSYTHTFESCDRLPSFFARFGKDGIVEREVQGLKVGKLELSVKTEEAIVGKISCEGRTEQENPISSPSFSDLNFFVFHKGTVTRDGSEFKLAMEMVVTETNSQNKRPRIGSQFDRDQTVEGGESGLSFKFLFESAEEYRRFWGTSVSRSPQGQLTAQVFKIDLDSFDEIWSGGDTYGLTVEMHKAFIEEIAENVNSRDVIESTGTAYLEEDATEDATMTVTLVNGVPAY